MLIRRLVLSLMMILAISVVCETVYSIDSSQDVHTEFKLDYEIIDITSSHVQMKVIFVTEIEKTNSQRIDIPNAFYAFQEEIEGKPIFAGYFAGIASPEWIKISDAPIHNRWLYERIFTQRWSSKSDLYLDFPYENLRIILYIGVNSTDVGFNTDIHRLDKGFASRLQGKQISDKNDIPEAFRSLFGEYPSWFGIEITVFHQDDFRTLVFLWFELFPVAVIIVMFTMLLLSLKTKRIRRPFSRSDFIQFDIGVLVFIPLYLLYFIQLFSPPWMVWTHYLSLIWAFTTLFLLPISYRCTSSNSLAQEHKRNN